MTLHTLSSGSQGNCLLLSDGDTHILVDAGISTRRIKAGLAQLELSMDELDGILITHEHTDHISGLATLIKHHSIPLYASPGTARQLDTVGRIKDDGIAEAAHNREGTHVDDQVMITQADAPLGEHDIFIARMDNLIDDIFHVFRSQELAFFYVDAFTRCSRGFDQIRLPAEKGRNLDNIQDFGGRFHLVDFRGRH